MFPFSFKFLQTSLIIKELIKHKNKSNRKVSHDRENSENRFSWTFLGSLHNETVVKHVFHEMVWKKHFTVYSRLKNTFFTEHVWAAAAVLWTSIWSPDFIYTSIGRPKDVWCPLGNQFESATFK